MDLDEATRIVSRMMCDRRELDIPLKGGARVQVKIPAQMTEENFNLMISVLMAVRPGVVVEEPITEKDTEAVIKRELQKEKV